MENEQVPVPPVTPEFPPPVAPPQGPPPPPSVVYPAPIPVPPARPGRTTALVVGIVVGIVVIIGGLGTALFFVAQSAISSLENSAPPAFSGEEESDSGYIEQLPLVEGESSPPLAAEPMVCAEACVTQGMLSRAVPARSALQELGLEVVTNPLGIDQTSPDTEFTNVSRTWVDGEGDPEECFFAYFSVPIAATLRDRPATSTDQIDFLSYANSSDEYSYLTMSTRLFRDSMSAEQHMASVHELVPGCTDYDIGSGQEFWTADVTPVPALSLPASVGATGWVEDGPFGRFYVIDLQRGNLVVRTVLGSDGAVTEAQFRSFMEDYAVKLSELDLVK